MDSETPHGGDGDAPGDDVHYVPDPHVDPGACCLEPARGPGLFPLPAGGKTAQRPRQATTTSGGNGQVVFAWLSLAGYIS